MKNVWLSSAQTFISMGMNKKCNKCGVEKSLDDFYAHPKGKYQRKASCKACDKKYYQENKQAYKDRDKKWKKENYEKHREYMNSYDREQYHNNPKVKLRRLIFNNINSSLKAHNKGKVVFDNLGFTPQELVAHLESQFKPEMNWGNHGDYWEIEHETPISYFDNPYDAWTLDNIYPATKEFNRKKGNRYVGRE